MRWYYLDVIYEGWSIFSVRRLDGRISLTTLISILLTLVWRRTTLSRPELCS